MKKLITFFLFVAIFTSLLGQTTQTIAINKPLKEFPDVYDLSTPLNAGVTILYFSVNGTESLWEDVSSFIITCRYGKNADPDRTVKKAYKERRLNDTIKEVIVYKDSIACVITKRKRGDSYNYYIRNLVFEDGKWLNRSENYRRTLEDVQKLFDTYAPEYLDELRRSDIVKKVSTDTLSFVNYVKEYGVEPKEFLLNALAKHPLVIYGEIHRRKISWDLLSNVLQDPRFVETVGTVFVELPAYQQEKFDRFYASMELDTEILLDIMRSMMLSGWHDKGEYEFLVNLWKLNHTLTTDKKIRVVPTDEQLPWSLLKTAKEVEKYEETIADRNTRMADVIEHTMNKKTDTRNSLFIVGYGHAQKSLVPGSYSSAEGQEPALTAGAQLAQRLSDKNVFTILQHGPCLHNRWGAVAFVRQGLFDSAFEITGNNPVAFPLAGSPFGIEPYDADPETCFDNRSGNFANNFDGYIFLQPLKDEDSDYMLFEEIWNYKFIKELERRYALFNWNMKQDYGIKGKLTKEKIIKSLKEDGGKKRWSYLFE
jgi:hypothetical protein